MGFKDLGDWAEIGGLKLPISGKVYSLPPVSAELGPRLQILMSVGVDVSTGQRVAEADQVVLNDMDERKLYEDVLGTAYGEMVADGVPWPALKHAAMTVMIDATVDRASAEAYWESAGKSPAPAAKKPDDRLPPKARKATATRTPKASTAGTTTRKRAASKAATRGRPSSSTGA